MRVELGIASDRGTPQFVIAPTSNADIDWPEAGVLEMDNFLPGHPPKGSNAVVVTCGWLAGRAACGWLAGACGWTPDPQAGTGRLDAAAVVVGAAAGLLRGAGVRRSLRIAESPVSCADTKGMFV